MNGGGLMNNKNLCLKLAKAENEKEIINILKKERYWDNPDVWQYYGGIENNFATIGNQQRSADSALVEKIINSVDAVLMRECLKRGIDPEGCDAPETLEDALDSFFEIDNGSLANLNIKRRYELAENIRIVATGSKRNPSYAIIDKGEGQSPNKIPKTFLSLTASNKIRIPFVQGKFNMGGTGALLFCGENHLQFILTKRCPQITEFEAADDTSKLWGFTIVRKEEPMDNMKSSTYKYLAPNEEILSFSSDSLPLIPSDHPNAYGKSLKWGTFIKLYEYQLQPISLRTLINFNLNYRLSLLLPNIALPILLEERRNYSGKTMHTVLSGLSVRLEEDKSDNLEEGFPSSDILKIGGQEMKVHIYIFKKGANVESYKKREGIIFTINGQSHGYVSKNFFSRKSVGMSYLSDSIFVIVDCTNFSGSFREKLFMNSRDRLRDGALKKEIIDELEKIIKNHPGLRELKEKRRQEDIGDKIKDSKPLVEILENVIKKSPTLSNLLIKGERITNPFNLDNAGKTDKFQGKEYPTFFSLKKEFSKNRPKLNPQNQKFRIIFETDANNDYFTRDNYPGELKLRCNNQLFEDYNINLWNGIATLNAKLPEDNNINDIIGFNMEVTDISQINPFQNNFFVKVLPPTEKDSSAKGEREKPAGGKGNNRKDPSLLKLPNIIPIKKDEWNKYGFNNESALLIRDGGEEGYDFFVNMDNVYLLTEIKSRIKDEPEILKSQYQYGLVLIAMSLLNTLEEDKNEDESLYDRISKVSKALSPMLLPMITSLGELENF